MLPAIVGGIAAGAASSLLAPKVKAPNYRELDPQINKGADRQNQIATSLKDSLAPGTAQYGTDRNALTGNFTQQMTDRGQKYMTDASKLGTESATNLSNTLRQNVLSAQPQIQNSLRESLAASGGLNRGAAPVAFGRAGQEASAQIGQGEAQIQQQRLQGLQDAAKTVFGTDIGTIQTATGMDADTLSTLFNSGREDLIREAQSIIDTERNRTANLLGTTQGQMTTNLATSSANATNQSNLLNSLLNLGGQGLASYLGNKTPAAASIPTGVPKYMTNGRLSTGTLNLY